MISLATLFLAASAWTSPVPRQTVELTVSASEVSLGDSVTVSWSAPGATRVFLSEVGVVPASGSRRVLPTQAAVTYLLAAEFGPRMDVRTRTVTVRGARGAPADTPQFRARMPCLRRYRSRAELMARVQEVLTRRLHLLVSQRVEPLELVVFQTTTATDRLRFPAGSERRPRTRRTFFRVTVSPRLAGGYALCEVAASVQWLPPAESVWYHEPPESTPDLYEAAGRQLAEMLADG